MTPELIQLITVELRNMNALAACQTPAGHSYRRSTTTLLPVATAPKAPTDDNDPESYSLSGATTPLLVPAPAPVPAPEHPPASAESAAPGRGPPRLSLDPLPQSPLQPQAIASPTQPPRRLLRQLTRDSVSGGTLNRWQHAVRLVCERMTVLSDPWAARGLHLLPVLRGRRRRYSAHSRRWTDDDVLAKMEARPFANGSMRQCFAMKKLSTFSAFRSWLLAGNFVAKVYMSPAEESAYVDDVQLQMEAKRFGDAYNARNPPKKARVSPTPPRLRDPFVSPQAVPHSRTISDMPAGPWLLRAHSGAQLLTPPHLRPLLAVMLLIPRRRVAMLPMLSA